MKMVNGVMRGNSTRHGMTGTREYKIWVHIIQRCYNPKHIGYHLYGGRGIRICDEWRHDFSQFIKDVGLAPSKDHSIDRFPNHNGNYEPGNTRWANKWEQQSNRRSNRWLECNGERLIVSDWARRFGIYPASLSQLLKRKTIDELYQLYLQSKTNN